MQAPVFNSGLPVADGYYLLKIFGRNTYFETWKFYKGKWVNRNNEPNFEHMPNYVWAFIPSLGEWSDKIADAPLGTDILIIDEYGRPAVSSVSETEDTPHKRKWIYFYQNPTLWHIILDPLVENFENSGEDNLNVEGRKASYGGFKSRNSSEWRYVIQEMKRYQIDHDQDLDCNQDVDCMTPKQINAMLAAVEELKKRNTACNSPIRAILPPLNYKWKSQADERDWREMILNLPYELPKELYGIPRELREWCLDAARTLS